MNRRLQFSQKNQQKTDFGDFIKFANEGIETASYQPNFWEEVNQQTTKKNRLRKILNMRNRPFNFQLEKNLKKKDFILDTTDVIIC